MRRIGVGIVALAVVGAGVLLLVTLPDDDGEGASGTDTTTPVTSEAVLPPPTTRASTTTAAPETTDAEATTASPETTEAAFTGDPATTASADETDRSGQIDPQDESDTTTATESSPPGSVAYDLDSEASCEIAQTLRRGDTGPQVECLQERLNEVTVGGQPFAVDGAFGEQTEAAVRAFQEANELGVDGVVGPATGELLGIWAG
jgi:peptidoglycan hydrolase-like protein with peptidoglycan-binding domain